VNTDAWRGYGHLKEHDRPHATVDHSTRPREWPRDDDGDGVRETHTNSVEGLWTGLRNFLRPFRGVHKKYLQQYVSVFAWTHNLKQFATQQFALAFTGLETSEKILAP
jgi:transposase-like protein